MLHVLAWLHAYCLHDQLKARRRCNVTYSAGEMMYHDRYYWHDWVIMSSLLTIRRSPVANPFSVHLPWTNAIKSGEHRHWIFTEKILKVFILFILYYKVSSFLAISYNFRSFFQIQKHANLVITMWKFWLVWILNPELKKLYCNVTHSFSVAGFFFASEVGTFIKFWS